MKPLITLLLLVCAANVSAAKLIDSVKDEFGLDVFVFDDDGAITVCYNDAPIGGDVSCQTDGKDHKCQKTSDVNGYIICNPE